MTPEYHELEMTRKAQQEQAKFLEMIADHFLQHNIKMNLVIENLVEIRVSLNEIKEEIE